MSEPLRVGPCDRILEGIAQSIGLPTGGPWAITLEWVVRASLLNEPSPTQVNVYAESPRSVILFECTFTEQDGGACSQTVKQNGSTPCNGNYVQPSNHRSDLTSRCPLSGKGIQYWDIIPKVFHLDAEADYQPCPFAGPAYQWMRNLVVTYKVARQRNKQPALVIVYADSSGLPMAQKVRSRAWTDFTQTVRQDQVPLHVRSYQEILTLAQETIRLSSGDHTLWNDLAEWVNKKISAVNVNRRKTKRRSHLQSDAKHEISATGNA